jgi:hypothetical protein
MDVVGADPDEVGARAIAAEDPTPPIGIEVPPSRAQRRLVLAGTPSTRRGAGALIVAAGALTVFVAAYWLPSNAARYDVPGRPWVRVTLLVLAVAVANVIVYGRRSAWLPGLRTTSVIAGVLIVLSGLVAAWAVDYTRAIAATGYPDAVGPVTLIGCGVLVVGALLAVGDGDRSRRITPQAWSIAGSVAVCVIIAAAVIAASAEDWTVSSHTLDDGRVGDVPVAVDAAAWRRTEPGGDAAAGGPGAIIAVDDLLSGVAAADGREVWFYRRSGADIQRLAASPDGATVYAELVEFDPDGNGVLVVDAATGQLRFATNRRIDDMGSNVSNAGVVESGITTDDTLRIVSRSGTVEGQSWRWEDASCVAVSSTGETPMVVVTGDRVIAAQRCGPRWAVVALDAQRGEEAWRVDLPRRDDLRVHADGGLGVVTIAGGDEGPSFYDLESGRVLRVDERGYDSGGLLVVTDERNAPQSVLDPTSEVILPLSPALEPVVDRDGTVLALAEQLVTVGPVGSALAAVDVSTVARNTGAPATIDTDLPAGDLLRLMPGPGAVFAVVQSNNGEVTITALR